MRMMATVATAAISIATLLGYSLAAADPTPVPLFQHPPATTYPFPVGVQNLDRITASFNGPTDAVVAVDGHVDYSRAGFSYSPYTRPPIGKLELRDHRNAVYYVTYALYDSSTEALARFMRYRDPNDAPPGYLTDISNGPLTIDTGSGTARTYKRACEDQQGAPNDKLYASVNLCHALVGSTIVSITLTVRMPSTHPSTAQKAAYDAARGTADRLLATGILYYLAAI